MILLQRSFIFGVRTPKIFKIQVILTKTQRERISGKLFLNHGLQVLFSVVREENVTYIHVIPKAKKNTINRRKYQ